MASEVSSFSSRRTIVGRFVNFYQLSPKMLQKVRKVRGRIVHFLCNDYTIETQTQRERERAQSGDTNKMQMVITWSLDGRIRSRPKGTLRTTVYYLLLTTKTTTRRWQCLRNYSSTVWRSTRGQKGGQRRLFKIFVEMSSEASALLSRFKEDKLEFRARHVASTFATTLMNNYRWHFILSRFVISIAIYVFNAYFLSLYIIAHIF